MRCRCGEKCCAQGWDNRKNLTFGNASEILQPSGSSVIVVRLRISRLFSPDFFFFSGKLHTFFFRR